MTTCFSPTPQLSLRLHLHTIKRNPPPLPRPPLSATGTKSATPTLAPPCHSSIVLCVTSVSTFLIGEVTREPYSSFIVESVIGGEISRIIPTSLQFASFILLKTLAPPC
ncbi:unnamed protein product [Lactuca virosa]|uniref:Uncharacterized protein n=1 Tax=Lactuca virosa TaxID=75947 RepID=A0AAU9PD16_9ASTR|nr:unnamed protein product [Lactuca virosa]